MRSNNQTLGGILQAGNQYVIPRFQRYYRWDKPEWERLWADLVDLQKPGKTGRHFMGFLVLVPEVHTPDRIPAYQVIDGQQRLTTLSLLLCAIRNAALSIGCDSLADEITKTSLVHPFRQDREHYRVYPRQRDRDDFFSAVRNEGTPSGRIGAALRYFAEQLALDTRTKTEAGLRFWLGLLTARLEFVHATLEGENPYNIFRSLNSTGVELGSSDLIRNFMFMHVPAEEQDAFDDELWSTLERSYEDAQGNIDGRVLSAFFRDFLMQSGGYIRPDDTFEVFQQRFSATDFRPAEVARQLLTVSVCHRTLCRAVDDNHPAVNAALANLHELDSSTTYPLLLNLFARRAQNKITDDELAQAVQMLEAFIVRRLVCGESSRPYAQLFVQACAELGEAPLANLQAFLERKGDPSTPRFVEAFSRFDLYHSRYARYMLERLEQTHPHKERADLSRAQIEHIMPQTLTDEWRSSLGTEADRIYSTWLNTPGNLTLSGYNPELNNRSFPVKRGEYKNSNIVMTRQLAEYERWGEAQVLERGRRLAEVAAQIWTGPVREPQPVEAPAAAVDGKSNNTAEADRHAFRQRYWMAFGDFLRRSGSAVTPPEPKPDYWRPFPSDVIGVSVWATVNIRRQEITAGLTMRGPKGQAVFDRLKQEEGALERELGAELIWSAEPGRYERYLTVALLRTDPTAEALWPQQHTWLRDRLEALYRCLQNRIQQAAAR